MYSTNSINLFSSCLDIFMFVSCAPILPKCLVIFNAFFNFFGKISLFDKSSILIYKLFPFAPLSLHTNSKVFLSEIRHIAVSICLVFSDDSYASFISFGKYFDEKVFVGIIFLLIILVLFHHFCSRIS